MNDLSHQSATTADRWAVAFALLFPTLVTYVYFILLDGADKNLQIVSYGVLKTVQFGFPLAWVWLVQRQRIGVRPPRYAPRMAMVGIAFAVVVVAGMALLYRWVLPAELIEKVAGEVRAKVAGFGANSLAAYVALASFYALFHSLAEEYYWRWFVFGQLRRLGPVPAAVAISSVGFALHHVLVLALYFGWASPMTWLFSAAVAIGGAFWAWLYHRSETLYSVWLSHALVDAGIFLMGWQMIGGTGS